MFLFSLSLQQWGNRYYLCIPLLFLVQISKGMERVTWGAWFWGEHKTRKVHTINYLKSTTETKRTQVRNHPIKYFIFKVNKGRPGGLEDLSRPGRWLLWSPCWGLSDSQAGCGRSQGSFRAYRAFWLLLVSENLFTRHLNSKNLIFFFYSDLNSFIVTWSMNPVTRFIFQPRAHG